MSREQAWVELRKAKERLSWATQVVALKRSALGGDHPDTKRKEDEYLAAKRAHDVAERKWDAECSMARGEESNG